MRNEVEVGAPKSFHMEDDTFDRRSVHSDMNQVEYDRRLRDVGNIGLGSLHSGRFYQSETALHKGSIRNQDSKQMEGELEALRSEVNTLSSENFQLRRKIDSVSLESDSAQRELDHTRHSLNLTKDNLYLVNKDLTDCRYERARLQSEVERLQNELEGCRYINKEIDDSRYEISRLKLQIEEYKEVNNRQKVEIDGLRQDLYRVQSVNMQPQRSISRSADFQNQGNTVEYNHGQNVGTCSMNSSSEQSMNGVNRDQYIVPVRQTTHSGTSNTSNSHPDEPKFRLPYFNGKSDFQSFWSVFEIGVRKFGWDNSKQIEQLFCNLKDDALTYLTRLPPDVKTDASMIKAALERRYGDNLLPEQHRENLNQIKKHYKESLSEYATRVSDLVQKAYSGINSPGMLTTFTIESLLKGWPDQSLAYEVRTKRPKSVDEAMQLITWHECCKNGSKRTSNNSVRQVEVEDQDIDIRKVNGGRPRYVTEERLESRLGVFSREIQQKIDYSHNQLRNDIKELTTVVKRNSQGNVNGKSDNAQRPELKEVTCFKCSNKGHISKYCPLNKDAQGNSNSQRSIGPGNNGKKAGNQAGNSSLN